MSEHQERQILKIFSGPHVGAEMFLADGQYTIGSGEDCDIVLQDRLIAPRHACIEVAGARIECRALDGAALLVEGQPNDKAILAPFQYFTLGSTHLAVGPADGAWPATELPDVQLGGSALPAGRKTPAEDGEPAGAGPGAPAPGALLADRRRRRRRWLQAAALLLVGLSVSCWLLTRARPVSPAQADPSPGDVKQRLREVIAKHAPGSDLAVWQEKSHFYVEGYVASSSQRYAVERALPQVCPAVQMRLWDSSRLVRSAEDVLEAHDLDLTVSQGGLGEVVIQGETTDRARWERVLKQLREDIPALRTVTDQVRVVRATSGLSPGQSAAGPQAAGATAASEEETVPFKIRGASVGVRPWLVLQDGKHVFPGAVVEGGYAVKAITPESVVLSKDNRERVFPIGGP